MFYCLLIIMERKNESVILSTSSVLIIIFSNILFFTGKIILPVKEWILCTNYMYGAIL